MLGAKEDLQSFQPFTVQTMRTEIQNSLTKTFPYRKKLIAIEILLQVLFPHEINVHILKIDLKHITFRTTLANV